LLARLREKPGAERVEAVVGDMARTHVDGDFSLVYLVFNTIFNLTVLPWRADEDAKSFYVYDTVNQRLSGRHYYFVEGAVQPSPIEMRYAWPAELDLMARLAGMRLEHRWAGWRREAFTGLSPLHVSVYEKP
jgi:hypothetical protein